MSEASRLADDAVFRPIHRLTVAQYRRMAEAGVLGPDDDVELLEGILVEKITKNPPHRIATRRVRVALERCVPTGFYVDSQEPIATADSEPEPDAAVIRGVTEDYLEPHPPASCVPLVVEVAAGSLRRDREIKARVYARAGIPTYWLLDIEAERLVIFTDPASTDPEPAYRSRTEHGPDDDVPVVLDTHEVARVRVADLLPPKR